MARELNEDTGFQVSIKTLVGIGAAMATVISMWFMLQADIAEARELPAPLPPDVTRMEFDMKDQMIRQTIISYLLSYTHTRTRASHTRLSDFLILSFTCLVV